MAATDSLLSAAGTSADAAHATKEATGRLPLGHNCYIDVFKGEYVGVREFTSYGGWKIYPTKNGTCMNRLQWCELVNHEPTITQALFMMEPDTYPLDETFYVEVVPDMLLGPSVGFHRTGKEPYSISGEQWKALVAWSGTITDRLFPTVAEALDGLLTVP